MVVMFMCVVMVIAILAMLLSVVAVVCRWQCKGLSSFHGICYNPILTSQIITYSPHTAWRTQNVVFLF